MQMVYQDWAGALQEFSLGAINNGIELARAEVHPPNQGEFVKLCRLYKPPTIDNRIELKPMDKELAKDKLAEIKKMMETMISK